MATRDSKFVPVAFTIAHPLSNVRLLEASTDVVQAIEDGQTLSFKSLGSGSITSETANTHSNGQLKKGLETARGGLIHLCSEDKCWAVKQVSTSNSVYVTRSQQLVSASDGDGVPGNDEHAMDVDGGEKTGDDGKDSPALTSELGLNAFAKPTDILELYPISQDTYETTVSELMGRFIPVYAYGSTSETEMEAAELPVGAPTRKEVYDNIPFPNKAIVKVFSKACVFEVDGKCYIPIHAAQLSAWRKVVEACTLTETSLNGLQSPSQLKGIDDPVTYAIAEAILKRDGLLDALNLYQEQGLDSEVNTLNEVEASRWVGNLVLASDKSNDWPIDKFISAWEDSVPAAWMKHCTLEVLGSLCEVISQDGDQSTGNERVRWRSYVIGNTSGSSSKATQPASKAASTGKRKWHEKFAAQRDAKK